VTSKSSRAGLLAASALLVVACATVEPTGGSFAPGNADAIPSASSSAASCGHQSVSVDYGPYYIAGLHDHGTLAFGSADANEDVAISTTTVVATVQAVDSGVYRAVYGTVEVVTPIEIDVEQPIHGDATTGPMRVYVEGGTAGCYTTTVDAAPYIDVGTRYLLFLTEPAAAPSSDEPTWAKIIVAWPVDQDDVVQTIQGPKPLADLIAAIDRIAPGST
jgi:hypothetical protein